MNPLDWFPGKKTYLLGLGAMCTATGAFLTGAMDVGAYVEAMFAAAMGITIRKGVG